MPRTAAVKEPLTPTELFENALKSAAKHSRTLASAIGDFRKGDAELADLMLETQLGFRKLQKALIAMEGAHKTMAAQAK